MNGVLFTRTERNLEDGEDSRIIAALSIPGREFLSQASIPPRSPRYVGDTSRFKRDGKPVVQSTYSKNETRARQFLINRLPETSLGKRNHFKYGRISP
jgi:hypothetical protein